jgi:hypothetical protein
MRITATLDPVPDDYPWNGSDGVPGGFYRGGETEDYPVVIHPGTIGVDPDVGRPGLWLDAPKPNPARDDMAIGFGLSRSGKVSLAIYDLAGRKVRQLAGGSMAAGRHDLVWDGRDAAGRSVPIGVYLIELQAEGRMLTRRAIRVR